MVAGEVDYTGELTEKEIIREERNSGVISNRVREIQVSKTRSEVAYCSRFSSIFYHVIKPVE